jgi:VanZ family protein
MMIKLLKKNIFSIATIIAILYLSLASESTFSKVSDFGFHHLDKVVHICMYFGLMTVLLFENRLSLKNNRSIILLSIIPLTYGVLMEILQSWLTTTRTGDVLDAVFDLIGILFAIVAWKLFHNLRRRSI